ncbi:MAG: metallophosphoesterase [Cellulophaga sp.]|nr:metallophosphoesterase [Cellulophaga sp.]
MKKLFLLLLFVIFTSSCATYKTKYAVLEVRENTPETKNIRHTVYLIGDAGLSPENELNLPLQNFKNALNKANKNSTAIFLGDNIYPAGLPEEDLSSKKYTSAINQLDAQLITLENFKGRPLFIPGNHDWYSKGLEGLKRQEKYIESKLKQKDPFLPENGCPLEVLKVSPELVIIVIDTEWYLTNWDKHPTINDDCAIKSRSKFWDELESVIKKNVDKTTLIAMHHPMFTYGNHGGQFSLKQQLIPTNKNIPLPILGSAINVLRTATGASTTDVSNRKYREFKNRIVTLAQYSDKVIFASGHEHTMQYIVEQGIPQIVSGAGAKKGVTRLMNGSQFSTGHRGYAVLDIFDDGSSQVKFYGIEDNQQEELLFNTQVLAPDLVKNNENYENNFPETMTTTIYTQEEIDKSGFYKKIWGERYRDYYGKNITAPTVQLDTLFGGLTPVRKGGGNQSKSLRLRHKNGKEYVMRAIRKVSELYLQAMLFQNQYVLDELDNTFAQELLQDFYTGSHPFAPFVVADLSDAVGIYHTNPKLYYIPKQNALAEFNTEFGDELYMIEEHAGEGHGDLKSFGYSNTLISTDELLENLRDDEKYSVDAQLYTRARLFDMVLGDWDRHVDQWRWAEFKDNDTKKITYRPVPRDRDQVFSILGDGLFMSLATRFIPGLRLMEGFKDKIRSVEGLNSSPKTYVLDMALLSETTKEEWLTQAAFIQKNLTADVIDQAFKQFPDEVQDEILLEIKRILLSRIKNIKETAEEYYRILNHHAVVAGTDKDDWFEIERLNKKEALVSGYRNIGGEKEKLFFKKIFHHADTKEIWIYGLDDDDKFIVTGNSKNKIKIRLVGGQNNDVYDVEKGRNTIVYDYKSKKNTLDNIANAKLRLTDDYSINTYEPLKIKKSLNQILPNVGFNPDTGLKLGALNKYTFNSLVQNPFTQQHIFNAGYFFATSGFELGYKAEFARIFGTANLEIATQLTSPNFAVNFFGFGNETANNDDELDLDYNRVRLATLSVAPSLVWRGDLGSKFRTGISYEAIEVEETDNRFINTFFQANGEETNKQFLGVNAEYSYANSDNVAFPTMGMATALHLGYKTAVDSKSDFAYIIPSLSINHKLNSSGKLVLAVKWKAHYTIGDGFEFYQAASIGGSDGLRGFRNERFTGKKSFYQNTDLRLNLGKFNSGILPTALGFYGGFDYGRVWNPNEISKVWHTSYGGGFFLDIAGLASIRTALFNSVDGLRVTFGLGFGF